MPANPTFKGNNMKEYELCLKYKNKSAYCKIDYETLKKHSAICINELLKGIKNCTKKNYIPNQLCQICGK